MVALCGLCSYCEIRFQEPNKCPTNQNLVMRLSTLRIIIVSSDKDLTTTRKAIKYYSEFILHKDMVIIAPLQSVFFSDDFISEYPQITLVGDEDIKDYHVVKEFLTYHSSNIPHTGRSVGWYLQQFIKLSYLHQSPENVFLSDGDTIFSRALIGKIIKDPFLITTREDIGRYMALGLSLGMPMKKTSYISNGGFFDTRLIRQYIESPVSFFKRSFDLIFHNKEFDFSEYQILGSINAIKYRSNPIRIFRRWDLLLTKEDWEKSITPIESALDKYDAISWETEHTKGCLKRIAAKFLYFTNFTW